MTRDGTDSVASVQKEPIRLIFFRCSNGSGRWVPKVGASSVGRPSSLRLGRSHLARSLARSPLTSRSPPSVIGFGSEHRRSPAAGSELGWKVRHKDRPSPGNQDSRGALAFSCCPSTFPLPCPLFSSFPFVISPLSVCTRSRDRIPKILRLRPGRGSLEISVSSKCDESFRDLCGPAGFRGTTSGCDCLCYIS